MKYAVKEGACALRVALPGRVISFNPEKQTAFIKPLIPEIRHNDDDTYTTYELPTLYEVPVYFPGSFQDAMTWPLLEDSEGWLVFCDRSIDKWMQTGDIAEELDLRRHDISDAAFFPGVKSAENALAEFDNERLVVGRQNGPRIAWSDDKIEMGQGHGEHSTESVPLGDKMVADLQAALNALKSYVDSLNQAFSAAIPLLPYETGLVALKASVAIAGATFSAQLTNQISNLSNDLSQKVKVS